MTFTISEFVLGLVAGSLLCPLVLVAIIGIVAYFYNRNMKNAAKKIGEKQMGNARNGH